MQFLGVLDEGGLAESNQDVWVMIRPPLHLKSNEDIWERVQRTSNKINLMDQVIGS